MCGRARCTLRPDDFARACHLNQRRIRHANMDNFRPSHNVAPGFNVPVLRRDDGGDNDAIVLHCMKWGLIPSFTKKSEKPDHFKMFNARSESIREKASFRRLLPANRCLVCVEGFYEWKKDGSKKQPYYVHFKDGRPMVFAALFDSWKDSEGEIIYTFTIITTSSSSSLEWLHDRMPVVLGNKESIDGWLEDSSLSNLHKILKPYEEADLAWYPVTTAVGKLSFDGPECIKEVQVKTGGSRPISQFFAKKPKLETSLTQEASEPKSSIKEEADIEHAFENTNSIVKEETEAIATNTKDDTDVKEETEAIATNTRDDTDVKEETEAITTNTRDDTDVKEETEAITTNTMDDTDVKEETEAIATNKRDAPSVPADKTEKAQMSPSRKRSKKVGDSKQPTLLSFFGKS